MKKIVVLCTLLFFIVGISPFVFADDGTTSSSQIVSAAADAALSLISVSSGASATANDPGAGGAGGGEVQSTTVVRTQPSFSEIEFCFKKLKAENPGIDDASIWSRCKNLYAPKIIASAASAQSGGTAVSITTPSPVSPTPECDKVNDELKKELDNALAKYESLKSEAAQNNLKEIETYIEKIKEKIIYNKKSCWKPQLVNAVSAATRPECEIVKEQLKADLENAYKKLNYARESGEGEEKIKYMESIIVEIKTKIESNKACEITAAQPTSVAVSASQAAPTLTTSTAWIESTTPPSNVAAYYQVEMEKVLSEGKTVEDQIVSLKSLRVKIDVMIEELIKKKQSIAADDFNGLVEKFKVKPKEIIADNVKVSAVNKTLVKEIGQKEIIIQPEATKVVLSADNVTVKTDMIEVTDKLIVDGIELKAMPGQIKENIKEEIKDAELIKEKEKLLYKIKTSEDRKFLGIFKIAAEKSSYLDASNEAANLVREERPWWFFLTTN